MPGLVMMRARSFSTISLEDPVSKWVPFINTSSPSATGFTIAELQAHTSGYPARLDTANYFDIELSFQQNAGVQLWSPPGEVFNRSTRCSRAAHSRTVTSSAPDSPVSCTRTTSSSAIRLSKARRMSLSKSSSAASRIIEPDLGVRHAEPEAERGVHPAGIAPPPPPAFS
jgi:hypothetical protein